MELLRPIGGFLYQISFGRHQLLVEPSALGVLAHVEDVASAERLGGGGEGRALVVGELLGVAREDGRARVRINGNRDVHGIV